MGWSVHFDSEGKGSEMYIAKVGVEYHWERMTRLVEVHILTVRGGEVKSSLKRWVGNTLLREDDEMDWSAHTDNKGRGSEISIEKMSGEYLLVGMRVRRWVECTQWQWGGGEVWGVGWKKTAQTMSWIFKRPVFNYYYCYRGYCTAARGYEFYLQCWKYLSQVSEQHFVNEISKEPAAHLSG